MFSVGQPGHTTRREGGEKAYARHELDIHTCTRTVQADHRGIEILDEAIQAKMDLGVYTGFYVQEFYAFSR